VRTKVSVEVPVAVVPVMVRVYTPGAAVLPAVNVSLQVVVKGLVAKVPVTFAGSPVTVRVTLSAPFMLVTPMVV
jgi:hypothetical protein